MKWLFAASILLVSASVYATSARSQVRVTNQGISDGEIVVGTHQDLSGPAKSWGVNVANGMKMAVAEVNAAGGIHGRKLRLVIEDSKYDPKTAVLMTQKMIEKDRIFVNLGAMGSPTVLAAQDITLEAGVIQLFPVTSAEFTYKFDPAKPQERLKFSNLLPYVESMAAATEYLIKSKALTKPCSFMQDDEYGMNVKEGYDAALKRLKLRSAADTTYKRGATDFSAQAAKLKAEGCDLVVLGAAIREPIGLLSEAAKLGFASTWLGATPINVLEIPALGKELVEGLYAAGALEIPYADTAKGPVKAWIESYTKAYASPPATQAIIGYNSVMTFAHYARLVGRDLTGSKLLDALESGDAFQDIFASPPTRFSKTNHLATTVTSVQQVRGGRWVVVKGDLQFTP